MIKASAVLFSLDGAAIASDGRLLIVEMNVELKESARNKTVWYAEFDRIGEIIFDRTYAAYHLQ